MSCVSGVQVTNLAGPIGTRLYGNADGYEARFYYPGGSACPRKPSLTFCVLASNSNHAIRRVVMKDGAPDLAPICVLPSTQSGYEFTVNGASGLRYSSKDSGKDPILAQTAVQVAVAVAGTVAC